MPTYSSDITGLTDIIVKRFELNYEAINWFTTRSCRIGLMKISLDLLNETKFEQFLTDVIEMSVDEKIVLNDTRRLENSCISQRICSVTITDHQNPAVMKVFFSLLKINSSVRRLYVRKSYLYGNYTANLCKWMEHIRKIGAGLRGVFLEDTIAQPSVAVSILECCPCLEKLSLRLEAAVSDSNILQILASNCPHLRSLNIAVIYLSSAECDADLTAFAEKCPQLEELCINCEQLTDQSVIALAQHCSRLKKLTFCWCNLTYYFLIVLSERGLPLEELLVLPNRIPIPFVENTAQCAHALSRIAFLNTRLYQTVNDCCALLQYMTGLRKLHLDNSEDHLLVPHLLLLLQGQCCAGLESLSIGSDCSITPQQFCGLVAMCSQLHALHISKPTCTSDAVLLKMACSYPHLQKVTLDSNSEVTEEGVLALAVHCRQLREIHIPYTTLTEETVRQLAQHCRRLTELRVIVRRGDVILGYGKQYSSKEIRALRESISAEVITHRCNNICCIIL